MLKPECAKLLKEVAAIDNRKIDQEVLALPGGGEIITYSSTLDIPVITNLSGSAIKMKSEGIAIRE